MDMWSYYDLQDSATGFLKLSNFVTYKGRMWMVPIIYTEGKQLCLSLLEDLNN